MITIKKLCKKFQIEDETLDIFKDLSLSIKKGSTNAIIGTSGSWKSTFLNMISWLDTDFEGKIVIGKQDTSKLSEQEITEFRGKNISFIFQNFNLFDNLTVKENIDIVLEINNLERNFSTDEIIELVWLKDKTHSYPFHLSGGEKQRIAIARAFVWNTWLLLADEPTGNLYSINTKNIMDLIIDLNKKTKNTIIMITHDLNIAKLADNIYELKNYGLNKK